MKCRFSLYRSHIEAAQFFWRSHLTNHPGNILDATLGQGKDTLHLAKLTFEDATLKSTSKRKIFAVDIQDSSVISSRLVLQKELSCQTLSNIDLIQGCHSEVDFEKMSPLTLVVYNLGYLPGSDKSVTTLSSTTIASLQKALSFLMPQGMITITSYPGHDEGKIEHEMLLNFLWDLPKKSLSVSYMQFAKESSLAPTLCVVQKAAL